MLQSREWSNGAVPHPQNAKGKILTAADESDAIEPPNSIKGCLASGGRVVIDKVWLQGWAVSQRLAC
jgi:hypothetical protein